MDYPWLCRVCVVQGGGMHQEETKCIVKILACVSFKELYANECHVEKTKVVPQSSKKVTKDLAHCRYFLSNNHREDAQHRLLYGCYDINGTIYVKHDGHHLYFCLNI